MASDSCRRSQSGSPTQELSRTGKTTNHWTTTITTQVVFTCYHSKGGPVDMEAVVIGKTLLQGIRAASQLRPIILDETKDATALYLCLGFSVAVAALLHASSLEVVLLIIPDVYLEGRPEPHQSSLMQTGSFLFTFPPLWDFRERWQSTLQTFTFQITVQKTFIFT